MGIGSPRGWAWATESGAREVTESRGRVLSQVDVLIPCFTRSQWHLSRRDCPPCDLESLGRFPPSFLCVPNLPTHPGPGFCHFLSSPLLLAQSPGVPCRPEGLSPNSQPAPPPLGIPSFPSEPARVRRSAAPWHYLSTAGGGRSRGAAVPWSRGARPCCGHRSPPRLDRPAAPRRVLSAVLKPRPRHPRSARGWAFARRCGDCGAQGVGCEQGPASRGSGPSGGGFSGRCSGECERDGEGRSLRPEAEAPGPGKPGSPGGMLFGRCCHARCPGSERRRAFGRRPEARRGAGPAGLGEEAGRQRESDK